MEARSTELKILFNPSARGGRAGLYLSSLESHFERFRSRSKIEAVEDLDAMRATVRSHGKEGFDGRIVACGGDGTVRAVASGLLESGNTQASLGIVPLGSGNDFSKALGIRSIAHAIDVIDQGHIKLVDALKFDSDPQGSKGNPESQYGFLFVGVGAAGHLLQKTTNRMKKWLGGRWGYRLGFFRALPYFRAEWMRVETENSKMENDNLLVLATNVPKVGGQSLIPTPDARLDDGLMDVLVVESLGFLSILRVFMSVSKGTHRGLPGVHLSQSRWLNVRTRVRVSVQADGDLCNEGNLNVQLVPSALRVICPNRE